MLVTKSTFLKEFPIYICIYGIFFVPLRLELLCVHVCTYTYVRANTANNNKTQRNNEQTDTYRPRLQAVDPGLEDNEEKLK